MTNIQVKNGYKQTEIGVIPDDWTVEQLGNKTVKIGSGITPTGGEKVYKTEGRPFLRSQNIGWGKLLMDDVAFISDEIHNTFKGTEILNFDVFLNITGASIGRSAVADKRVENGNVNQHVCIIRTNQSELNSFFLNFFLLSNQGQKQIDSFQAGGNRQGLNFGQIKSFKIPLPPQPEQKAIAAALSAVDEVITSLDKLLTKKRNIKQSAMQQLLTGKKRLPGFRGEWEMKKVGDICDFIVPGRNKPKIFKGDIPWITTPDLEDGRSVYVSKSDLFISRDEAKKVGSKIVPAGSVIMSCAGELGIVALTKNDIVINQQLHAFIPSSTIDASFLLNTLKTKKRYMDSLSTMTAVPYLNKNNCNSIPIFLPPTLKEQKAIAATLSYIDAEIEAIEKKRDKYKAIKQGMMQELLTGRIRLKYDERA